MRERRGPVSLTFAERISGVARADLSKYERGREFPPDDQVDDLERVYGPWQDWYPATTLRAVRRERDCARCGDPLEPSASGARRYCESCR